MELSIANTGKVQISPLRKTELANGANQPTTVAQDRPKKTRASRPKVRTGCQTCKIRRVKCDETKPECGRCTSTGRKCDGYYIPPRKNQASNFASPEISESSSLEISSPDKSLGLVHVSPNELQALEFFHNCTAPGLSLFFDSDFWTKLVLQMSFAEPAIKHAMVAAGWLHKRREFGGSNSHPPPTFKLTADGWPVQVATPTDKDWEVPDHNDPFAISHYNKALSLLSTHLKRQDASVEVTLLACILFVGIEFLRGDSDPALKHFQAGMNIALASLAKAETKSMMTTSVQRMREHMLPFFNRLELLSTLFGNDAPWTYPVELVESVPSVFMSLNEARNSLVHLMNLSLRFIRYVKYRKYDRRVLPDDLSRRDALLEKLAAWKSTFSLLMLSGTLSSRDLNASKILLVHHIVSRIWLDVSIFPEECAHDVHMPDFENMIKLAEDVRANSEVPEQLKNRPSSFLFDMEVVSPLYFVAMKCRQPQLRRRTIALLRNMARREGLWDSKMAAAVAERSMEIEEEHLTTLDGSELPLENHRLQNAHINSVVGLRPGVHSVVFHAKPEGVDGDWKLWTETIVAPGQSYV
ncbi:Hypothetical protein R9X50_00216800 [Acrodontium crateriforme]|uniref:Zn(2)-C6 fungal-type domain-containing protein n=1 Tax=Acrodontium crateriforme TaxID=150365 RepID=A0AAQ3R8R9_9PEZI|nr:Hypothetical protein R9X50_00216800 [Acrodontium crateriforme]